MDKKKVFISTSSFGEQDPAPIKALEDAGFDVLLNPYKRKLTKEESLKHYPHIDGLIAGLETLDQEVLSHSKLKVISRCGSGMSNVDVAAAKQLGIAVYSTPKAPVLAVAELTVGAMLSLLRSIPQMNASMHNRQWVKQMGHQLTGKTVAIIGFGLIGRAVASLLQPFEVSIVTVDPFIKEESIFPNVSLQEALLRADIITLHASGDHELLGFKEFAQIKQGAFLLNVARGGLINEQALVDAIKTGKVAGAWLDVFGQEPYQGPLCDLPQVILTPHVGSYTEQCRRSMEMEAVNHLIAAFKQHG